MDYSTYVSQLANLMATSTSAAEFLTMLPGCVDYANLRIQRDMDLVATSVINTSAVFSPLNRFLTLPTDAINGAFVVVEEVNAITPSSATVATGTRYPLQFVSKNFIDMVYPSQTTGSTIPKYMYLLSNTELMVAPSADQAYPVEIIGTIRLAAPSTSNSSTYLLTYFPDLFMAASMVFASGYMRDFGSQADNPVQAQSWENQYQVLKSAAEKEEARKKSESQGWTTEASPQATPSRM